jgi:hypothetical protein
MAEKHIPRSSQHADVCDPSAAEGLQLIRLYMSVKKKADRDELFQLVKKHVQLLHQKCGGVGL